MMEKYRATIHGNTIEWDGDAPADLTDQNASIKVDVTVVSVRSKQPDGKKMAEALAEIAARGGVTSILDPVEWQREIRKDRPLPDRG